MEVDVTDRIAQRWGIAPDDALNYATIPSVQARTRALAYPRKPDVPWTSPYPPGSTGYAGPFTIVLDAIHPPERPIERLLSLCCGHGHAERALAHARKLRSFDGVDISPAALVHAEALARAAGLEGINYFTADINELALTGTYDFAYAGGLHHIQNLEHVCAEVREHLSPGAPFMMYEYVGSSRCQYPARHVEVINACIRLLPERLRVRITSQRELGTASAQEAYEILRRRHASRRQAVPIAADLFPMAQMSSHGEATLETRPDHWSIVTESQRWSYAASVVAAGPIPEACRGTELVLVITGTVREGQIGIGCVAADFATYVGDEVVVGTGPRTTWRIPFVRPGECHAVVFRNASNAGQSSLEIEAVTVAALDRSAIPGDEDRNLAGDFELKRHFWTEFVPMTVEQWLAIDPSESVRSSEIIPVLRATFPWVEVRYMRSSVLQFVLYDLAANFYGDGDEVRHYLDLLFHIEDVVMSYDEVPENFAYIVASDRDLTTQNRA